MTKFFYVDDDSIQEEKTFKFFDKNFEEEIEIFEGDISDWENFFPTEDNDNG